MNDDRALVLFYSLVSGGAMLLALTGTASLTHRIVRLVKGT